MIKLPMVISGRGSNIELPEVAEFHQICEQEIKFPVHLSKEKRHYPEFETVIGWMQAIGLEDRIFAREILSLDDKSGFFEEADGDLVWGNQVQDLVVRKTLEKGEGLKATLERVTGYLYWTDEFVQADVALVYGGNKSNPLRAKIASGIYKEGRARKLLFTGRGPVWKTGDSDTRTEARAYADMATNEGVNPDDIILEEEAITVADNGRRSLKRLAELGLKPKNIALVTSWFCMRRAVGMLWKHVPNETQIYAVPAVSLSGNFALEGWYKNPEGIRVIFNEFVKMRMAVDIDTA